MGYPNVNQHFSSKSWSECPSVCPILFRFQHSSLLMEHGGAHARTWPYYFSVISFSQKPFRETSYLSIRVRLWGNQEHPIMQVTDTKKAGGIIGGVKNNGASLDGWFDYMSSFQLFEAFTYGRELGSLVDYGIGFTWSSGSNKVPWHDGPYPHGWEVVLPLLAEGEISPSARGDEP